jgi:hypothetical protein
MGMNSDSPTNHPGPTNASSLKKHWLFYTVVALMLSSVLHLLLLTAFRIPDHHFLGSFTNAQDMSVYLAAMRQGGAGEWLFQVTFTAEPIQPKVSYPLYIFLGWLADNLGLSDLLIFHLARLIGGCLTLTAIYFWLRISRLDRPIVKDSFILIALGGGLGWFFLLFGIVSPDITVPEWTVFLSLSFAPHFILAIGAEVLLFTSLLHEKSSNKFRTVLAGFSALGIALLYPYDIMPLLVIVVLFAMVELWLRMDRVSVVFGPTTAAATALLASGTYYALVARLDPLWGITYVTQNHLPAPGLAGLVGGLGLLGILAGLSLSSFVPKWKQTSPFIRLLVVWLFIKLIFLYLPFPFQVRFSLGLHVPTAVLGAVGLHSVLLPWLARHSQFEKYQYRVQLLRRVIIGASLFSTLIALSSYFLASQKFPESFWITTAEVKAADWLATNSDESDLVLSSFRTGNYLPRVISGRVFLGHLYTTVDPQLKAELVQKFFAESTGNDWRQEFLEEWGITYIYYGQFESGMGPMPTDLPIREVYSYDNIAIFLVDK